MNDEELKYKAHLEELIKEMCIKKNIPKNEQGIINYEVAVPLFLKFRKKNMERMQQENNNKQEEQIKKKKKRKRKIKQQQPSKAYIAMLEHKRLLTAIRKEKEKQRKLIEFFNELNNRRKEKRQ